MRILKPTFEITSSIDGIRILKHIERCARKCYKSEEKITEDSYKSFVKNMIKSGHESTIEHGSISVDIQCNRQVTHELVRHRIASYSQESTRYVNYSKDKYGSEIKIIKPFYFDPYEERKEIYIPEMHYNDSKYNIHHNITKYHMNVFDVWMYAHGIIQWAYMTMVNEFHRTAQEAASVLTNSTSTEIAITANPREWRHIFKLRCSKAAHPQMREIMLPLLKEMNNRIPILFEDLFDKYETDINNMEKL